MGPIFDDNLRGDILATSTPHQLKMVFSVEMLFFMSAIRFDDIWHCSKETNDIFWCWARCEAKDPRCQFSFNKEYISKETR